MVVNLCSTYIESIEVPTGILFSLFLDKLTSHSVLKCHPFCCISLLTLDSKFFACVTSTVVAVSKLETADSPIAESKLLTASNSVSGVVDIKPILCYQAHAHYLSISDC